MILVGGFTAGCATASNPKEDLRSIFVSVKNDKSVAALQKFNNRPTVNKTADLYVTYDEDRTVCASGGNQYCPQEASIEGSNNEFVKDWLDDSFLFVGGCKNKFDQLTSMTTKSFKGSDQELLNQFQKYTDQHEQLNKEIRDQCLLDAQSTAQYSPQVARRIHENLSQIKKYAGVDLFTFKEKYKELLEKENARIKLEIAEYEKASKVIAAKMVEQEIKEQGKELNDPQFYKDKVCEYKNLIAMAQKAIKNENEVGRISGVVDKEKLHKAGTMVRNFTELTETAKSEYKKKFGKPLGTSHCK